MSAFKAIKERDIEDKIYDIERNLEFNVLFSVITGSRLYGTHFEKGENPLDREYVSDYDYRGVYETPLREILRIKPARETDFDTAQIQGGEDEEYYDIKKFLSLAANNNPNIMDIIFAPDEAIIHMDAKFKKIREYRKSFLHKGVVDKFIGYAEGQLSRLNGHNTMFGRFPEVYKLRSAVEEVYQDKRVDFYWIQNNFSGALARKVTGISDQDKKPKVVGAKDYSIEEFKKDYNLDFNVLKYVSPQFNKEEIDNLTIKERSAMNQKDKELTKLWDWNLKRNEKRALLEKKFGYDTKHGMHLIRLLLAAKEIITTGDYNPRLSGRNLEKIKAIRNGEYAYNQLMEEVNKIKSELPKLLEENNHLPEEADYDKINEMLMGIYQLKVEEPKRKNQVITITGGTASGKTTFAEYLVDKGVVEKAITYTTRPKREGEVDGVDYHFISEKRMKEMFEEGQLVEPPNEHGGNYYAVAKRSLISRNKDKPVVIIVDPNGANYIHSALKNDMDFNLTSVFIEPLPRPEIVKRMVKRKSTDEEIVERMEEYQRESTWGKVMNNISIKLKYNPKLNQESQLKQWEFDLDIDLIKRDCERNMEIQERKKSGLKI